MARALGAAGYDAETSGLRLNVGWAGGMIASIETRLEAHVAMANKKGASRRPEPRRRLRPLSTAAARR